METLALNDSMGLLNEHEAKYAPNPIYYEGDIEILSKSRKVSVIGSRKVSNDGITRAQLVTKALTKNGITVVSGLAEGVDTVAHTTAIEDGGRTITVLGTPLDKAYPKKNEELLNKIKRDHLAISQFPKGYPVQPKNFPIRNRTMALISDATIIIEAGEKSGTRHQAREALRLGRELYLLESLANDPQLTWPRQMIGYGAKVMTTNNIDQMLEELPDFTTSKDATFINMLHLLITSQARKMNRR